MTADEYEQKVEELLHCLGITENYKGFSHTAYAVQLAASDHSRLQFITKLVYPDVAKHYGTTWNAVERNMRTAASIAWENNEKRLSQLAGFQLPYKPSNGLFLSILVNALSRDTT